MFSVPKLTRTHLCHLSPRGCSRPVFVFHFPRCREEWSRYRAFKRSIASAIVCRTANGPPSAAAVCKVRGGGTLMELPQIHIHHVEKSLQGRHALWIVQALEHAQVWVHRFRRAVVLLTRFPHRRWRFVEVYSELPPRRRYFCEQRRCRLRSCGHLRINDGRERKLQVPNVCRPERTRLVNDGCCDGGKCPERCPWLCCQPSRDSPPCWVSGIQRQGRWGIRLQVRTVLKDIHR